FEARARKDGVTWSPGAVAQRIVECRADCHGIPVFRTRFAGEEMLVNGEPVVLMVCYRGGDRCSGTFFVNVPEDQVDAMRQQSGEWQLFLQKWDEADLLPRRVRQRIGAALSAPVHA
ncbi:MAG: hypothetical protein GWN30_17770, partial [Gammaproteobacteria bacterium]|nr:hypothetical protein [Gammaproteobacteria bacterium]